MSTRKVLTLVVAAALAACGGDAKKISTGSVSGSATIAGAANSAGIIITVAGFTTTTDAAGNYSIGDVPQGTQAVQATAPNTVEGTQSVTVSVGGAATAPAMVFHSTAVLSGVAIGINGAPNGTTVALDGGSTTATTNASGIYSFGAVAPGAHSLTFTVAGGGTETIPTVYYDPYVGGLVPDEPTIPNAALYRLPPIDIANARRATSVDYLTPFGQTPSATVGTELSPDGAYIFFDRLNGNVSSPFCIGTGYSSLYVVPAAGGAPVLVTDRIYRSLQARWSPDSRSIVFGVVPLDPTLCRLELWSATITSTNPLTFGAPVQLAVNPGQWDFSPATAAGGGSTIYVVGDNAAAASGRALYEKAVASGAVINTYNDPNTNFSLSKKKSRLFFQQNIYTGAPATLTSQIMRAVACTGSAQALTSLEAPGGTFTLQSQVFSADEAYFGYVIPAATLAPALGLGLRVMPTDGAAASLRLIDANTAPGNIAIGPGPASGVRKITYSISPVTCDLMVAQVDAVGGTQRVGIAGGCPQFATQAFASDGTKILHVYLDGVGNYILAQTDVSTLAAAAAPVVLETIPTAELQFAAFAANGGAAAYIRRPSPTVPTFDFWLRTPSAAAVKFDTSTENSFDGFAFGPTAQVMVYGKRVDGFTNTLVRQVATPTAAATQVARQQGSYSFSTDSTHLVMNYNNREVNLNQLAAINLTTGAVKQIMRRASFFRVTSTAAGVKLVAVRTGSPAPYRFQDGVYIADLP